MNEFVCRVPEGWKCEIKPNFITQVDIAWLILIFGMLLLLAFLFWLTGKD
jgi:hypothetical protein